MFCGNSLSSRRDYLLHNYSSCICVYRYELAVNMQKKKKKKFPIQMPSQAKIRFIIVRNILVILFSKVLSTHCFQIHQQTRQDQAVRNKFYGSGSKIGNTLVVKYSLQGPQKRNKQEDVQSNLGRNAKEHVSISHLN